MRLNTSRILTAILVPLGLAACSSGSDSGSDNSGVNNPPIVDAGVDNTANERDVVVLTGSVTDDTSSVSISWSQISGPLVELDNPASAGTFFRAPNVRNVETVVLQLTANDGTNAPVSDDVRIDINNTGNGPDGPSPQGIPDDGRGRRDGARGNRGNRNILAGKEVRTYDGSSNNIANPEWGATFIHLQRLGAADYTDGASSLAGAQRPSARVISNDIVAQSEGTSIPNTFSGTDFVWQWGQFMDHDLDLTDGAEESADIAVPAGDVFFDPDSAGSVTIAFSRALFDPSTGFNAGDPREQENEITSWIDGSMVYGSSDDRVAALRETASPFLATSAGNLLPFNTDSLTNANGFITDPTALFLAGDIRANEQVGLTTMHTLFVREHNRVAAILEDDFPNATDDEIFEATRRIVIAKIQKITFEEWLPALVGADAIAAFSGYNDTINASVFNEFSVAAFRLGHSMLNEQMLRIDASGGEIAEGHLDLANAFFTAPQILTSEGDLDPILRGLATQQHQAIDVHVVSDVRNFLFGAPGDGGLDLPSLNIQRGRDHGVPDYNSMRTAMGLTSVTAFSEITSDAELAAALEDAYGSVDDIDLWVGGLAEDPVDGSQLGELFQAIMVKQFTDLRDGDRFWYEEDLTNGERDLVRGTTLASVIKDNTGIGDELQDNVFLTSDAQ